MVNALVTAAACFRRNVLQRKEKEMVTDTPTASPADLAATDARLLSDEQLRKLKASGESFDSCYGLSPFDAHNLFAHIAAQADRIRELEQVIRDIDALLPVMITRVPVTLTYRVQFLMGVMMHGEAATLAEALRAAVASTKGNQHG